MKLEGFEMMRDSCPAHPHGGGDVDTAFLAVAEQPQNPQAGAIAELLEDVRCRQKAVGIGHML
jgi:hypothetical protein